MSRQVTYDTEIVVPQPQVPQPQIITGVINIKEKVIESSRCLQLLKAALDKVVRDHGGHRDEVITDCNGLRRICLLAVRTDDFPRGVGVDVGADGRVRFIYDAQPEGTRGAGSAQPALAKRICREIARNYTTLAILQAMQLQGFRTAERGDGERVIVEGVKVQ